MKNDNGGPAFPVPMSDACGMSLRDWFAGMAICGMWSARTVPSKRNREKANEGLDLAICAYEQADDMLEARGMPLDPRPERNKTQSTETK